MKVEEQMTNTPDEERAIEAELFDSEELALFDAAQEEFDFISSRPKMSDFWLSARGE